MGNLIKWKSIDSEATFDVARIYRSATETGSYTQIGSQSITDQTYYDANGQSTSWYKVDFYDTANGVASELSDPFQAGEFRGYCTVDDIRNMTNIGTSDLTDTQICNLITYAGIQINADINIYEEEERIEWISDTKSNEIDGSNTTFYTKHYPISDMDDNFEVNTNDITVYQYDSDGTRTELTVDSITPNDGKFTLASAPASTISRLTVTYNWSQRSAADPHPLIKQACMLLAAFWGYSKINVGKSPRWRMGSTQIWRDMDSPDRYYDRYIKILSRLNDREVMDKTEASSSTIF